MSPLEDTITEMIALMRECLAHLKFEQECLRLGEYARATSLREEHALMRKKIRLLKHRAKRHKERDELLETDSLIDSLERKMREYNKWNKKLHDHPIFPSMIQEAPEIPKKRHLALEEESDMR